MAFPNTDWPDSLDAVQDRTDGIDIVYANDFDYQDRQIRQLQAYLGLTSELIGSGIASKGPAGVLSPIASGGGNVAVKLLARVPFSAGSLLSVGDNYDASPPSYTEKMRLNYAGRLWTLDGADFGSGSYLKVPTGSSLPGTFDQGRLYYKTGTDEGLYRANGSVWALVGTSVRTAKIIVGNADAGDSIDDCDYLDVGNGAQLAAAIAAAGPYSDVYVRPGIYNFMVSGGPTSRITIPDYVKVRGSGPANVIIMTRTSADCRAFILGTKSVLDGVRIIVPTPIASQTTGGIVTLDEQFCEVRNVMVEAQDGWSAADPDDIYITSAFLVTAASGVVKLLDVWGETLPTLAYAGVFRGIHSTGGAAALIRGADITGAHYSLNSDYRVLVCDSRFLTPSSNAFVLSATADNSELVNNNITMASSTTGAIQLSSSRCMVGGNYIEATAGASDNIAIALLSGATLNVIANNRGNGNSSPPTGWDYAVSLASGANNNVVLGNVFGGGATYSDSGTGNDMAHCI